MTITLELRPELEAGFLAQADAVGVTPENYLSLLVERELSAQEIPDDPDEGSGMVWEDGLLVHRTGKPLPAYLALDPVGYFRDQRTRHILGEAY